MTAEPVVAEATEGAPAPTFDVVSLLLFTAGVLIALAMIGVEVASLLRGGEGASFVLGLYQLAGLGAASVLVTHALDLRASIVPPSAWAKARVGDAARVLVVAVQLGLLMLAFRGFALESPAFHIVLAPVIGVGFVLHELTPAGYRPAFFLALSFAAIYLIMGGANALWLIGLGVGLIGLCHVPIPFRARVGVILAVAAVLAWLRTGAAAVPWSTAVWPILGSIFMFRLVTYLYDLKYDKVGPGWAHRLGYFFLLPNVAFTLFPVVDYSAYRRGYYDSDRWAIYQKGVDWMARGAVQLLLYRVVYQEFTIAATAVATWDQLVRHLLSTFLLYLRVSGQFHLIVGVLHLFGFNLPETHKGYYLASSFTDLWRRINIYWKDFMMKVVYYPTFFALRKRGNTTAMVVATMVVFLTTWLLHSYQWFWLLGDFPITVSDTLFWGVLGGLLVVNALRESKQGRQRTLATGSQKGFGAVLRQARGVVVTFVSITVLWSLWMSPSFSGWIALWKGVEGLSADASERMIPLLLLGGMAAYGVGATLLLRWHGGRGVRAQVATTAVVGLLYGASLVPAEAFPSSTTRAMQAMHSEGLNAEDMTQLTRGYYEDLTDVGRFNSQLWEVYLRRPPMGEWPELRYTEAGRETGDFLSFELVPSASIMHQGARLTTNRLGLRDREYDALPAPGVMRWAVMGASTEMGWGVEDGETFEDVFEDRVNADAGQTRLEVLNFGVPDYTLLHQLLRLDRVAAAGASMVLLGVHDNDPRKSVEVLIDRAANGVEIPFPELRAMMVEAGLGADPIEEVQTRLLTQAGAIETWIYRQIAGWSQERGVPVVWMSVPMANRSPLEEAMEESRARATAAGLTTISLGNAFEGVDLSTLQLREFDHHPNVHGHRLLAQELFEQLSEHTRLMDTLEGRR